MCLSDRQDVRMTARKRCKISSQCVPYFTAFSFPLARANEYEAEGIAVQLTSSRTAAEALTSLVVMDGYLNRQNRNPIFRTSGTLPTIEKRARKRAQTVGSREQKLAALSAKSERIIVCRALR